MDDLISRRTAIELIENESRKWGDEYGVSDVLCDLADLPSAQPTLYGYEIEHLAYIAKVMQKEGVTAEYAVRTFDDMSRALRMIIEEAQERLEKYFQSVGQPKWYE